ncbi:pyridoxamine 5'-phosphate oxidase family protein [Streptomyces sp. CBMA152]|uniref:pyridoxamine 5'-phosphate oxidase family protein n=1 Tax=Streptomyces sp. CBMA152 TaxID=1896312 RepID=UPI001660BDE0|nr:TIGR03618 family F420-dependent PPOX class oxidoreductase [Streptomyces sp. CBMA152]MBD0747609.1 pyridoxamine 5'-phosphate oxidase [Streptomyces sp. CBMA152]
MSQPRGRTSAPEVSASVEAFLAEPLVATLTTLRPDGSPHVAPVRFTWDAASGLARVMTVATSRKARNVLANPGSRAVLCQVEGFSWVSLEGTGLVSQDPQRVSAGVQRYAKRYWQQPPSPPGRVVLEIAVDKVISLNT